MIHYKELGLVNSKQMLKKAIDEKYGIPAFNFSHMEQLQAIISACVETKSPVILQTLNRSRQYIDPIILSYMAKSAVEYAKKLGYEIPIVLHLDHGDSFELCKECIDSGFSSVMIDGSQYDYETNVSLTKKVVDYAHQFDVSVEGELGVIAGAEGNVMAKENAYTQVEEVVDFVHRTGVDSLAISIGTSHGSHKFKPEDCIKNSEGILIPPPLRFDILEKIEKEIPGFPIVLHGASAIPQEYIKMINDNGGNLKNSIGIPDEQIRKAVKTSVCKINVESDASLGMTATIREIFTNNPEEYDPRIYLGAARDELKKLYKYKTKEVFGSAGKA